VYEPADAVFPAGVWGVLPPCGAPKAEKASMSKLLLLCVTGAEFCDEAVVEL
jgi:hypothetical protein